MPELPVTLVVFVIVVAVALVMVPSLWRVVRPISTLVHEAGHAVVALLTGRRVHAVKLFHHGGGCTTHSGIGSAGQIFTTGAGYLTPPLVGALMLIGLVNNVAATVLLLVAVPIVLLLLWFSRNLFGGIVTVAVLVGVIALVRYAAPEVHEAVALGLAVFLMAAGVRSIWELIALVRAGSRSNDAAMLARMTPLPAMAWALLFLVVALGAVAGSGRMLWGTV